MTNEMTIQNTQNDGAPDLICFSHLRWGFVFQRPQHLMSRFARHQRVFFVEEPMYRSVSHPTLDFNSCPHSPVVIVTPHLPVSLEGTNPVQVLRELLNQLITRKQVNRYITWYYTPMALDFARHLTPELTIYDCMDELSGFHGAPPRLCELEQELFQRADLVFTGGVSLFEAKRRRHPRVHAFPSGVDVSHFLQARSIRVPFEEHNQIPRPRLGYAGVIDERFDLALIEKLAARKPEWQFVMVGPVVKIDPGTLPRRDNLHWLGMKHYRDLPKYFAGWDVGLLPFAMNSATRYISPTKTPEYLAAGLQVVSTPIRDVVRPYGDLGLARIGSNTDEFQIACEQAMTYGMTMKWRRRVDAFLDTLSWDDTWNSMNKLIIEASSTRFAAPAVMTAGKSLSVQPGPEALRV